MNKIDKYRKLTEAELKSYGIKKIDKSIIDFVNGYYPSSAKYIEFSFNNKYNDSTYDIDISYIGVYDENDDELLPLKATAHDSRLEWQDFVRFFTNDDQHDEVDTQRLYLKQIPELYVKTTN
jgi:hypothetical protein